MRYLITVMIFAFYNISFSQTYKDSDYTLKAKKIIISNSDVNFFDKLHLEEIKNVPYSKCNFLKKDTIAKYVNKDSLVEMTYVFDTGFKSLAFKTNPCCISRLMKIYFDKNLNVIYTSDLDDMYKGYNVFLKTPFVKRKKIEQISDSLSLTKNIKIIYIGWIYDLNKHELYWSVIREKGFKEVYRTEQCVDIVTNSLVSNSEYKEHRKLGKAVLCSIIRFFL